MCPDRQILSLFIDDELPSQWKKKFEAHLATCPDCRMQLEKYKTLQTVMHEDQIEVPADLESRVWDRVIAGSGYNPVASENSSYNVIEKSSRYFWNHTVSMPIPAAAAAVVVLIIGAFLVFQNVKPMGDSQIRNSGVIADIGSDTQSVLPLSDINDVLQYLAMEDTSNYVIIKLPETNNFSSKGEPALMRAADYSRRNTG